MAENKPSVGLVFFPAFDWAISPTHPERQERLLYTRDQIQEEGLFDHPAIKEFRPRLAEDEEILRTHIFVPSLAKHVTESHRIAAGGTILAADLVVDGLVGRSFALLRPPGHHANRVVHGSRGFCTINNEAIMVDHLRHRLGPDLKVAIVDTDAPPRRRHPGYFYNEPRGAPYFPAPRRQNPLSWYRLPVRTGGPRSLWSNSEYSPTPWHRR